MFRSKLRGIRPGEIKGFAEFSGTTGYAIKSRSYLIQAITSIIFTASVQHAAVNFPQAEYGSTLPAGIYHDFFVDKSADIKKYLPDSEEFSGVMRTLSVLSSLHYTKLGVYHPNITLTSEFLDDAVQDAVSEVLGGIKGHVVGRIAGKTVDNIVDDGTNNLLYFNSKVEPYVKKFRQKLQHIETEIKNRPNNSSNYKYDYLLPSKIPQSINI